MVIHPPGWQPDEALHSSLPQISLGDLSEYKHCPVCNRVISDSIADHIAAEHPELSPAAYAHLPPVRPTWDSLLQEAFRKLEEVRATLVRLAVVLLGAGLRRADRAGPLRSSRILPSRRTWADHAPCHGGTDGCYSCNGGVYGGASCVAGCSRGTSGATSVPLALWHDEGAPSVGGWRRAGSHGSPLGPGGVPRTTSVAANRGTEALGNGL